MMNVSINRLGLITEDDASECSEMFQAEIHHSTTVFDTGTYHDLPHGDVDAHPLSRAQQHLKASDELHASSPTTVKDYCVLRYCYSIYTVPVASWTSAADVCEKQHEQLLTINSDLEAKIITDVIIKHQAVLLSPVVFLNLRKESQGNCFVQMYLREKERERETDKRQTDRQAYR